ncbi:MAG TPA: hypothetical protein VGC14_25265 [Rhizobium sp.]
MIEWRSIENDEVHARLVEAIEKPESAYLWDPAYTIEFTPRVLPLVYGDGRALFTLATINQRPAYWVIRGCSTWGCDMDRGDATGPGFGELTDDILTDLEEQFGSGRCGYQGESLFYPKDERHCDCEECQDDYVASWPEVDGYGGCSWSRSDWPPGFEVKANPLSWCGNLLAVASDSSPNPLQEQIANVGKEGE